jgi:hypothetical protein
MSTYDGYDRRVPRSEDEQGKLVVCRVCWAHVSLTATERMDVADGRAFMRCPECGGSFLIREDDLPQQDDGSRESA